MEPPIFFLPMHSRGSHSHVKKRPLEYCKGHGWRDDNGTRHRVKQPYYHFIWPKDGKSGSKLGRTKDILTGKGPDIHVAISAGKNEHMWNRPRKPRWSRHTDLDDRGPDGALRAAPWVRPFRGHHHDKGYDFWTRTYRRPDRHMWSDATWGEKPDKHFGFPLAFQDMYGGRWNRGHQSQLNGVFDVHDHYWPGWVPDFDN